MLTERQGSTLVLTLSDPASRNSLSPQASAAGLEALERAGADPEVRCVVLRGDGEHFCGGGNLPRLLGVRDGEPAVQVESMRLLHGFVEALVTLPKPVIAAVEGFAAGAGVGLVLACDLVVAAEDAKFVLSYGRVGLSPDAGATWQLARRVPRAQALRMLWQALPQRADQVKAPDLLYSEADVSLKVIRDLLNHGVDEVIVDQPEPHERILNFLRRTSPTMASRVRLYEGDQPLLVAFGAEKAIRSTLDRRAPLPSGGYLIIDDTEAMTVSDVNSGGNVGRGGNRLEDTATKTNLEAAEEVVRQLRLRDIGGIVVIDFIDMADAKNRRAVKGALEAALERDRTRTFVADISPLGLVEMTRQNISDGPREVMTETCDRCQGFGFVLSEETVMIDACRAVARAAAQESGDTVHVRVNQRVFDLLDDDGGARRQEVEEYVGKSIKLEVDRKLEDGEVRVAKASAT